MHTQRFKPWSPLHRLLIISLAKTMICTGRVVNKRPSLQDKHGIAYKHYLFVLRMELNRCNAQRIIYRVGGSVTVTFCAVLLTIWFWRTYFEGEDTREKVRYFSGNNFWQHFCVYYRETCVLKTTLHAQKN